MPIDLREHLRRTKPGKHLHQLMPRAAEELVAAANIAGEGRTAILIDAAGLPLLTAIGANST